MNNTVTTNSDISKRQNQPYFQRLLKARQWRWAVAVRWQISQFALVMIAPVLALTIGIAFPGSKPWISFLAVFATLADVAWLDRAYKTALKSAARASELLDCQLLQIEWNSIVAGKPPTPEETNRAEHGWEKLRKKGSISNWYSNDVDRVSPGLARVICQRTNLTYDSDLRRIYRVILDVVASLVVIIVIFIGLAGSQKFSDFVLSIWVPVGPFFIWALRERFRQVDAVQSNEPIITESEKLINSVISGECNDDYCKTRSRLLQDAIFYRRSSTVLLLPGIYKIRRPSAEREMRAGAAFWVEKAGR